jgi:hypothetical protein
MSAGCTRGNNSLKPSKYPVALTQAEPTVRTNTFELDLVGSFLLSTIPLVN